MLAFFDTQVGCSQPFYAYTLYILDAECQKEELFLQFSIFSPLFTLFYIPGLKIYLYLHIPQPLYNFPPHQITKMVMVRLCVKIRREDWGGSGHGECVWDYSFLAKRVDDCESDIIRDGGCVWGFEDVEGKLGIILEEGLFFCYLNCNAHLNIRLYLLIILITLNLQLFPYDFIHIFILNVGQVDEIKHFSFIDQISTAIKFELKAFSYHLFADVQVYKSCFFDLSGCFFYLCGFFFDLCRWL